MMHKTLLAISLRLAILLAVFALVSSGSPVRAEGENGTVIYLPVAFNRAYGPNELVYAFMSDSSDAELGNLNCTSWLICREASYGNFWLINSTDATIESSYSLTGKYAIKRVALFFDTSWLPDGAVILSAKLRVYTGGLQSGVNKVHVVRTTATTPPGPSSFGTFILVSGGSAFAGPSQWVEIPLEAEARAWIHTAGFTRLGLVTDHDLTGVGPSGLNYLTISMWEKAGLEPELVVTYAMP